MKRIAKQTAALALALVMLLALLPGRALAADNSVIYSGTCGADGDNLTWIVDSDWVLTISGTGAMADYSIQTMPWYKNEANDNIVSLVIGDSVTSIGDFAFYGCDGLTSVTIPDSVKSIGEFAFSECDELAYVTIGNGVTEIGKEAFSYCEKLTDLMISDSVTTIGTSAFMACYLRLTSVTIPDSVTSIGGGAFSSCDALTNVTIGSGLKEGIRAFSRCDTLMDVDVSPENSSYCSVNGIVFNKDMTVLELYPSGKKESSYAIPAGVRDASIDGCDSLTELTIPDSVTDINITSCNGLTSLTLPDGMMYPTFFFCSALTSIVLPASVRRASFYNCNGLSNVTIQYDVREVVFYECTGLESVTLPDSISFFCFTGCSGLKSITIPSSMTNIRFETFEGCSSLTDVTIPNSVTSIDWWAFKDCTALTDVYFQGTQTEWESISIDSSGNECLAVADIHFVGAPAPSTVPVLTGATASSGQITVKWYDVDSAAKYAVYRRVSGGSWKLLSNAVTGTSYTDKSADLVAGTTYYYTVKANVNGVWGGYDKTGVSAKAIAAENSVTPSLTGAAASAGKIKVTWKAVDGAAKYAVYRKTADGSWTLLSKAVTGTSYTDKSADLLAGTTYYYTVKANVNGVWGGYDKTGVSAKAIAAENSVAPSLTGAAASAGKIKVTWKAVDSAAKYAVYRRVSGGSWTLLSNTVTGTSFTDKSSALKAGTTYYYTVKAYVSGAWSGYDKTGVSAKAVVAVPSLTGAAASIGQIKVTWKAVSGATKYAVYRKVSGGSWERLTNTVTGTSYTDKSASLINGGTYYYTVKAYGGGAWSAYDKTGVSAKAIVSTVPVLTGATASAWQIKVTWKAVAGAVKYAVFRKAEGETGWTRLSNTVTTTSFTDNSYQLRAGVTYYYTVRSYVDDWSGYDSKGVSAEVPLPDYPALISATASNGSITVKWEAVSEAMEYAVYRKKADENWNYLTQGVTVTGTSYTDKSAAAGTTYTYTVRVKVRDAWSRYDAAGVRAVIPSSKIPILQSATATDGVVTIDWKAVNGGEKYAVYRKTAGGNWKLLATLISGMTYYTDKSNELVIGTTYYYTVKAFKDGTWGGYDQTGISVKLK